jgi:hypothetical protein
MRNRSTGTVDIPSYVSNESTEDTITIDWFFGPEHLGTKIRQGILILIGYILAIIPIYITIKSVISIYSKNGKGFWNYSEGIRMWEQAIYFFSLFFILCVIFFIGMHIVNKLRVKREQDKLTVDMGRVARREEIANEMYTSKYGPHNFRVHMETIRVMGYDDVETYELRDRFRYFEMSESEK